MKITDMIDDLINESKNGWNFIVAKIGLRLAKKALMGYKKFLLKQKYPLGSLNYLTKWHTKDNYSYCYLWCDELNKFFKLTRELEEDETGYFTYNFDLYEFDNKNTVVNIYTLDYNKNLHITEDGEFTVTLDDGKVLKYIPTPIYHLIISVGICLGIDK